MIPLLKTNYNTIMHCQRLIISLTENNYKPLTLYNNHILTIGRSSSSDQMVVTQLPEVQVIILTRIKFGNVFKNDTKRKSHTRGTTRLGINYLRQLVVKAGSMASVHLQLFFTEN